MSEHEQENKKVYPGGLDRYVELRTKRIEAEHAETQLDPNYLIALTVAEELAGLNYLIDGIRYSARRA